jgi:glycine oxidase
MRIAIVGAGSIGLAVAWRAAQSGAEVVVHDPDPGSGASRVAAGMIAPVTESHYGEEALGPFMAASADAWPGFARELEAATGLTIGFRNVPTIVVGVEDGDRAEIVRQAELYRFTARNVETLTARAARKVEPLLSHRVRGGVLAPEDRAVDPRVVHDALLIAAERAGVKFSAERVENLDALDADQVVIAAGCGSVNFVGATATATDATRWTLPVRPVRGAVLRLRAVGDQPMPRTTVRGYVKGHPIYIVTRDSGEIVVGASSDERGFDRHTGTAGAVHDLLRRAIELVPEIAEYHLDEVSVGFRPGTPDNLPLIGRLDPRTVAATGHYRNGIALIPATASGVSALLAGNENAIPSAFDPLRFGGTPSASADRFGRRGGLSGSRFEGAPESILPERSDSAESSERESAAGSDDRFGRRGGLSEPRFEAAPVSILPDGSDTADGRGRAGGLDADRTIRDGSTPVEDPSAGRETASVEGVAARRGTTPTESAATRRESTPTGGAAAGREARPMESAAPLPAATPTESAATRRETTPVDSAAAPRRSVSAEDVTSPKEDS